jgi:YHS domain-containing protein
MPNEKETTMRRFSLLAVTLGFALTTAYAADIKVDGVKCLVAPKNAAKADKSRDYKGGKVFFCCDNCPKKFDEDAKPFAAKANAQLVQTGQAKQAKCPLTGGDLNKDTEITVAGAKVQFCCNMCKGKVEKAEGDAQLDLVFSDKAFEKAGFKVEKK